MIHIERKIKGEIVAIGWYENMGPGNWSWSCFEAGHEFEYEFYSGGCATSRSDAIRDVREEYRNQLKAQ